MTRTRRVTINFNGLKLTADVYFGKTPSGGPDPSMIEDLSVELVDPSDLVAYLMDERYEDWAPKVWEKADEVEFDDDGPEPDMEPRKSILD